MSIVGFTRQPMLNSFHNKNLTGGVQYAPRVYYTPPEKAVSINNTTQNTNTPNNTTQNTNTPNNTEDYSMMNSSFADLKNYLKNNKSAAQSRGQAAPAGKAQETATTKNNHNSGSTATSSPDKTTARQQEIERLKANIAAAAEPQVHTDAIEAHKGTTLAQANKGLGKESTADFANNSKTAAQTKGNSAPAGVAQRGLFTPEERAAAERARENTSTPVTGSDTKTAAQTKGNSAPAGKAQETATTTNNHNSGGTATPAPENTGSGNGGRSTKRRTIKRRPGLGTGRRVTTNNPVNTNNPSFFSKHKVGLGIGAGALALGGAAYLYNRHKKKKEEEKKRLAAEAEARRLANRSPLERARDKFDSLRHR